MSNSSVGPGEPENSEGSHTSKDEERAADDEAWWRSRRARVFVSCGQRGGERAIGAEVRDRLRDKGFCPYLAIEAHSSSGLTEEVYRRLRTAEYFVFIDFRRERLGIGPWRPFRGSLFSNQELAIASFLRTDILPFQQRGIVREGILDQIQGNAIPFDMVSDLPEMVISHVETQGWNSQSRRELIFERDPAEHDDPEWPDGSFARYFHIDLRNLHRTDAANECRVFLESAKNSTTGKVIVPDPIELKFKSVTTPFVSITPGQRRPFDAVVVSHEKPSKAYVGIFNPGVVDSGRALHDYTLDGPSEYMLRFTAWSREFGAVSADARLHLGRFMNDVALTIDENA